MKRLLALGGLAGFALAFAPAQAAPPEPEPTAAGTAFGQLAALAGTWRKADDPGSALRIRFKLTAGGTVLVEEWLRGTEPHSLTLYHQDGARLIATHYCPQGNQPRLALAGTTGTTLRFALRDVSDLDRGESHLHTLAFDFTDPAHPIRRERYRKNGVDGVEDLLRLVRVGP